MSISVIILLVYLLGGILAFFCISSLYREATYLYGKDTPEACIVYFGGVIFSWIIVLIWISNKLRLK